MNFVEGGESDVDEEDANLTFECEEMYVLEGSFPGGGAVVGIFVVELSKFCEIVFLKSLNY